jgi:adenylyltransferase/sulfurtransferase
MVLGESQIRKYSRNIAINEIGKRGQKKLLKAKVLIVGAGGLGSSCSFYLACAGIGRIGIVDSDIVEIENLQRQILHTTADLGKPKVESAKNKLKSLNPEIEVIPYKCKVSVENVFDLIKNYDIVVDCSDNFHTKYLLNDACVIVKKPFVYAAVLRFEGQLMFVFPSKTACYRCAFLNPPPAGTFITTQQAGIIPTVAGIMGLFQANEVLKYFLNIGNLLANELLILDLLNLSFRKVKIKRNSKCLVCAKHPKIKKSNLKEFFKNK